MIDWTKPLRREGYVVICPSYPNAEHDFGKVASGPIFRDGDALASNHPEMIIGRIIWNSDGSPVPLRACLPKAVAALVAERDEAREAVRRLAAALGDVLDWDAPAWGDAWASAWAESKADGHAALADPVVRRIVEGR